MGQSCYRLAYVVSHPIQYQAPLLRYLSAQPDLDLQVFFLSDFSIREYRDDGFGVDISWDVPLLEGYRSEFLPVIRRSQGVGFWAPIAGGLSARLRSGEFDAVWVHGYANISLLAAMCCAVKAGIPVLLRGESTLSSHPRGPVRHYLKSRLLPALFSNISAFLSIGQGNAEYYQYYGVPERRIFSMPYAVDNEFFQQRAEQALKNRTQLRQQLGLNPERPVILFAGKFQARKRPLDLLKAYQLLSPDGVREPRPYLLFVGDGELRAEVEASARALGWASVRFLGFQNQSNLPALYELCDVFSIPSQHEPWGLVVNEVMNAGTPVVVTDEVGAAADLVIEGETGFVHQVGDVEALAQALKVITESPELAKKMGINARQRIDKFGFSADLAGLREALAAVSSQRGI